MSSRRNVGVDFQDTVVKASRGYVTDFSGPGGYATNSEIVLTDIQAMQFWKYNPWVNAVVDRIVADITKIQPVIRPRDNQVPTAKQEKRIRKVRALLDNPNDNDESFSDIREKVMRDLLIIGRGAMEKVFDDDGDGDLSELYALVTRHIKIRADEKGNIPLKNAYKQERRMTTTGFQDGVARGKDGPIMFDRDEVIFMVHKPVSWTLYGHKALDTLANTVASDMLRAQYNSVFFTNNGEASGILSAEGMSKTELKKLKQYFQSRHKGASNAHRMLAMNVPVKFVQMAVTNRDMQFQEYGMELRQKIFAVYGMQPIIMGVLDASTGRLNSEQQTQAYKDGALKPILRKESYYYTTHICWEGFGYTDLEIVFPDVDLQDAKTQSELDTKDTQAAILTINEVRKRRNLPPVKWGDTPVITLPGGGQIDENGNLVAPSNQDGNKPEKKPASGEKKPASGEKKPAKEDKKALTDYLLMLRKWCLINYGEHSVKDLRTEFGSDVLKQVFAESPDDMFTGITMYHGVLKCITEKKFGSLAQLHKEIDTIFSAVDVHHFQKPFSVVD